MEQFNASATTLPPEPKFDLILDFLDLNYEEITIDQLKGCHDQIVHAEMTTHRLHLITALHRGKLYLRARCFNNAKTTMKDLYKELFGVSYPTAIRYENFATLILSYPKLIVCGLTFDQLVKHHNRLLKLLESDMHLDLLDKLRSSVTFEVQGKHFDLEPHDIQLYFHDIKLNTDADWSFEKNSWYKPEEMEELDSGGEEEEQETEMQLDMRLVHTVCLKLSSEFITFKCVCLTSTTLPTKCWYE